jgi:hypothetical protein
MARSRNIKPGFFTSDTLADLDPLTRLLFIGIWTIADKAGRLEDRPKRIRAEVLPYDNCDIDAMLSALERGGFILRYAVDGVRAIQVVNWDKHQNPHMKEAESTIPAPCLSGASPVQAPVEQSPSTERAGLIPDSLNLIPDSFSSEPIGSAAVAAKSRQPTNPPTDREMVFALGLPLLIAAAVPEARARSMLASLCNKHGDAAVHDGVVVTAKNGAGEPVSYLQRVLGKGGSRLNAQEALEQSNREVARQWAEGSSHAAA